MAEEPERSMLFDLRGKRRNVVKVVYAVLALLMGLSLFLTVGPFSLGDAFNSSGTSADSVLTDQADDIDERLVKDPNNPDLLLSAARIRVSAGNTAVSTDDQGLAVYGEEALEQYRLASDAWERYLATNPPEPSPNVALLLSNAIFTLATNTTDLQEGRELLTEAAAAQRIVAEARPTLNSLSLLAQYEYYAGNEKAGDAAGAQAKKEAPKNQQKALQQALDQYKLIGTQIAAQIKQSQGKPGQQLEDPLGDFGSGGTTGLNTPAPTP